MCCDGNVSFYYLVYFISMSCNNARTCLTSLICHAYEMGYCKYPLNNFFLIKSTLFEFF